MVVWCGEDWFGVWWSGDLGGELLCVDRHAMLRAVLHGDSCVDGDNRYAVELRTQVDEDFQIDRVVWRRVDWLALPDVILW